MLAVRNKRARKLVNNTKEKLQCKSNQLVLLSNFAGKLYPDPSGPGRMDPVIIRPDPKPCLKLFSKQFLARLRTSSLLIV